MKLYKAALAGTAILVLLLSTQADAQRWRLGIQAGGVGSKTYAVEGVAPPAGDYNPGYRSPDRLGVFLGYHANVSIEYGFSPRFSVTLEPGYVAKGYTRGSFDGLFARRRLHYLVLPVVVNVQLNSRMAAVFGPEVTYRIGPRTNLEGLTNWSLNGVVGFGYRVLPRLDAGLRYGQGVTPVNSVHGYRLALDDAIRNEPPRRAEYTQFVQAFLRYRL